jgi:T-box protein 2
MNLIEPYQKIDENKKKYVSTKSMNHLIFNFLPFLLFSRQALMASRGSDGDKLNPSHVSSSRGPVGLDKPIHLHQSHLQHLSHHHHQVDDDDKLLDVVGPPQSPLLSLSQSLQQMHPHHNSGEFVFFNFIY